MPVLKVRDGIHDRSLRDIAVTPQEGEVGQVISAPIASCPTGG